MQKVPFDSSFKGTNETFFPLVPFIFQRNWGVFQHPSSRICFFLNDQKVKYVHGLKQGLDGMASLIWSILKTNLFQHSSFLWLIPQQSRILRLGRCYHFQSSYHRGKDDLKCIWNFNLFLISNFHELFHVYWPCKIGCSLF